VRRQSSEQQHAHNVMATRALGLPGFVVLSTAEYGGELEQLVETVQVEAFCRSCGVRAVAHGRRPTWVRDLACGGRPSVLTWHKRIWRCPEPRCQARTWTETSEAIRARSVLTERARVQACSRVGQDATDVAAVAAELGVGWPTVMRAVIEYGSQLLDRAAQDRLVRVLGVDETAFLKATPTSPTRFATGLVDLRPAGGGPARLLDVVEGRSGQVLSDWIEAQGEAFTRGVQVAALDPFRGYHTALTSRLAGATTVLDPFHVVRLLTSAVDEVRRRVQNDTLGHRGRKGDPLYGIRRVLLRGAEKHTPASWASPGASHGFCAAGPGGEGRAAAPAPRRRRAAGPARRALRDWGAHAAALGHRLPGRPDGRRADPTVAGLSRRVPADRGRRRLSEDLVTAIEGLALTRPVPTTAFTHRRVVDLARDRGLPEPSYSTVRGIITAIDPGLRTLALGGDAAYRDQFEIVYRRTATRPHESGRPTTPCSTSRSSTSAGGRPSLSSIGTVSTRSPPEVGLRHSSTCSNHSPSASSRCQIVAGGCSSSGSSKNPMIISAWLTAIERSAPAQVASGSEPGSW